MRKRSGEKKGGDNQVGSSTVERYRSVVRGKIHGREVGFRLGSLEGPGSAAKRRQEG